MMNPRDLSRQINEALGNVAVLNGCPMAAEKWHSLHNAKPISNVAFNRCFIFGCYDCLGVNAYCKLHGNGCSADPILALRFSSESAKKGSAYGIAMFAKITYDTDPLQAIQICLRAAQLGFGWAIVRTAKELLKGTNVPQDLAAAHEWLQHAADINDPEGLCLLAHCFLEGKGVPKNIATAIDLYKRAQNAGDRHADIGLWLAHREASAQ
jgi:TPR repeat protein